MRPEKAQKKAATAQEGLLPGEVIWFFGACNNFKPMVESVVLTNLRLVAMSGSSIGFAAQYREVSSIEPDEIKQTVAVTTTNGDSVVLKSVPREDHAAIMHFFNYGRTTPPPEALVAVLRDQSQAAARAEARRLAAKASSWPGTTVKGRLTSKASQAIARLCYGDESPWVILTSGGGAGVLTGFDDRLAIIKTGALTSFMAGSLGGERSATFHYRDVTGIEFNSGFVNGVLEILTASYSGSANKDFWRGSNKSRNADSNDPWTLSNCLPLPKSEYNEFLPEINELRSRISRAKQTTLVVNAAAERPSPGLVEQLERLADLKASGVLTDDEFAAAKARLIAEA
jgi:hypothetical protein